MQLLGASPCQAEDEKPTPEGIGLNRKRTPRGEDVGKPASTQKNPGAGLTEARNAMSWLQKARQEATKGEGKPTTPPKPKEERRLPRMTIAGREEATRVAPEWELRPVHKSKLYNSR